MHKEGIQSKKIDEITRVKHNIMTNVGVRENLLSWRNTLSDNPVWKRRLDVFLFKMKQEVLDSHPEVVELQQRLQTNLMESKFTLYEKVYLLTFDCVCDNI